jgi:hypothetical protein
MRSRWGREPSPAALLERVCGHRSSDSELSAVAVTLAEAAEIVGEEEAVEAPCSALEAEAMARVCAAPAACSLRGMVSFAVQVAGWAVAGQGEAAHERARAP